jgi:hypothetical protein
MLLLFGMGAVISITVVNLVGGSPANQAVERVSGAAPRLNNLQPGPIPTGSSPVIPPAQVPSEAGNSLLKKIFKILYFLDKL